MERWRAALRPPAWRALGPECSIGFGWSAAQPPSLVAGQVVFLASLLGGIRDFAAAERVASTTVVRSVPRIVAGVYRQARCREASQPRRALRLAGLN